MSLITYIIQLYFQKVNTESLYNMLSEVGVKDPENFTISVLQAYYDLSLWGLLKGTWREKNNQLANIGVQFLESEGIQTDKRAFQLVLSNLSLLEILDDQNVTDYLEGNPVNEVDPGPVLQRTLEERSNRNWIAIGESIEPYREVLTNFSETVFSLPQKTADFAQKIIFAVVAFVVIKLITK